MSIVTTDDPVVRRMNEITDELERLARHENLTRTQEATVNALSLEFDDLRRERVRHAAADGSVEPGSYAGPGHEPEDRPARTEARARALDVLAAAERTDQHLSRGTLDHVARMVDTDESDALARWVVVAGAPDYRSAFHKLVRNPQFGQFEWTDEERQAFARVQELQRAMSLTDAAGGFMVPFSLDPAIILTSGGTSNVALRSAFTVKTIASDAWHGVTSAGVTAEWKAESQEVSDASPVLAQPTIPVHTGDAFVPFSFEVGGDAPGFAAEMAGLLSEAKERLEAAAFITGSGTGRPTGLVTAAVAAGKTVAAAAADTYAVADVYAVKRALPARWRSRAAWLANEDVYDLTRQFASGTGPQSAFWADFGDATPPWLLGRPAYESSEMDGSVTAAATNYLLVYGDLKQYYAVDRVGTTVELVPHLVGANRRPTGERGFLMWFRTGGDLVVPDAVRVLNA